MRALTSVLSIAALVALARTAGADAKADAARAALVGKCAELQKDYEASRSPAALASLGLCDLRLERDGDAIDAYSRYLETDPDLTGDEHARVVKDLQALEVSAGHLTLETNQPGVMISDERTLPDGDAVTNNYGPIEGRLYLRVRPGRHILKTVLAGFQESSWELDVFSASHESHTFVLHRVEVVPPPPKLPGRGALYGPFMLMGLGGAMLVAGTVTGIVAIDKANSIEDASDRTSAKTFAATTDILLAAGVLAAAGGLTWLLLEHRSEHPAAMLTPAGVRLDF